MINLISENNEAGIEIHGSDEGKLMMQMPLEQYLNEKKAQTKKLFYETKSFPEIFMSYQKDQKVLVIRSNGEITEAIVIDCTNDGLVKLSVRDKDGKDVSKLVPTSNIQKAFDVYGKEHGKIRLLPEDFKRMEAIQKGEEYLRSNKRANKIFSLLLNKKLKIGDSSDLMKRATNKYNNSKDLYDDLCNLINNKITVKDGTETEIQIKKLQYQDEVDRMFGIVKTGSRSL